MSNDKSSESTGRILYQSEIFKDGPKTGDNYSSSIGAEQGLEVFGGEKTSRRRQRPAKTHLEPAREIPVFAETDVLVVGGGPAGTAAAISAARLGADVLLVERYNHLGGLSTGGLVIWIDRMSDWAGKHIIRGFASDIMDRLPKEAVQGPKQLDWGSKDAAIGRLLGAADGCVPRHRHLVAHGRSGSAEDGVHADGERGQGAAAAARLGRSADPGRQCRQGRHLREQGRPPCHPRQGGDRHDRRRRPHRANARRTGIRHR